MSNIETIKNIVNLSNVDSNVEMFIDQYNTLNNTSFDSLDAILDTMKEVALSNAMKSVTNTNVTNRVTKYETDEQRRIARNEASKRCNDKKRAAIAAMKAQLG